MNWFKKTIISKEDEDYMVALCKIIDRLTNEISYDRDSFYISKHNQYGHIDYVYIFIMKPNYDENGFTAFRDFIDLQNYYNDDYDEDSWILFFLDMRDIFYIPKSIKKKSKLYKNLEEKIKNLRTEILEAQSKPLKYNEFKYKKIIEKYRNN